MNQPNNFQGAYLRLVVRSEEKGEALKALFPEYTKQSELAIVENMEAPGAFDKAVQGVTRIAHLASPLPGPHQTDNEHAYLLPAREGVLNLLKSAAKSESVKRVVYTSSALAVLDHGTPGNVPYDLPLVSLIHCRRTWTEKDWNPVTWEEGKDAKNPFIAYGASKKYAEKAAWEFMETEKPHFDLISLDAPGVFGYVSKLSKG